MVLGDSDGTAYSPFSVLKSPPAAANMTAAWPTLEQTRGSIYRRFRRKDTRLHVSACGRFFAETVVSLGLLCPAHTMKSGDLRTAHVTTSHTKSFTFAPFHLGASISAPRSCPPVVFVRACPLPPVAAALLVPRALVLVVLAPGSPTSVITRLSC